MDNMRFSFSDTIAGYVIGFDRETDTFDLKTTDGREFSVKFSDNGYGWIANNLGEPRQWCSQDQMRAMAVPGRYLFVYSIFYPERDGFTCETRLVGQANQSFG
jgi:hypothetical protein